MTLIERGKLRDTVAAWATEARAQGDEATAKRYEARASLMTQGIVRRRGLETDEVSEGERERVAFLNEREPGDLWELTYQA
jgi:hypothetical protein